MFTREQILEIQAKLASLGYRDTDFEKITTLNGSEIIAVVKDGINRRVSVNDIRRFIGVVGGGGGIVDVDDALSLTSENPVQNKVITSALKMIDVKITTTVSASYVFNDILTPITVTAKAEGIDGTAQKIDIYDSNGTRVGGNTNSNSCSISVALKENKTYYSIVTAYGGATKKSDSKSVTAVGHIYYGSGKSKSDFWSNKTARTNAVGSPSGSYTVAIRNAGDVFYFAVPSNMSISTAKLNDLLNVPLKAADTTSYSGYKLYEGSNTMQAGTYSITLS